MSTHPYIRLYVDDFEAATAHLTPEEDGVYNRLLRLCWRTPGCSLPNDHAWIARKIRMQVADFERVANPIIEEFFRVQRGRLVQKRLKAEYDDISRKKSARANAGKKGGEAKALKNKDNASSNASDLPAHTRAFPNPEPEPEKEEDANASFVAEAAPPTTGGLFEEAVVEPEPKGRGRVYPEAFEAAWKAYPHTKGRSSKPLALSRWSELPRAEQAIMAEAARRFTPHVATVCGGKGAPDMAVWIGDGKHLNWIEDETAPAPAPWSGPADVRAELVRVAGEDFARGYVDPCTWRDVPDRALVAPNTFTAGKLRSEVGHVLDRLGIAIKAKAKEAVAA